MLELLLLLVLVLVLEEEGLDVELSDLDLIPQIDFNFSRAALLLLLDAFEVDWAGLIGVVGFEAGVVVLVLGLPTAAPPSLLPVAELEGTIFGATIGAAAAFVFFFVGLHLWPAGLLCSLQNTLPQSSQVKLNLFGWLVN